MKRVWQFLKKICSELLILPIRFYQKCISPLIPPRCRFSPTCSCYAVTALRRFGPIRGSLLTLCRVARCQPFGRRRAGKAAGGAPFPAPCRRKYRQGNYSP